MREGERCEGKPQCVTAHLISVWDTFSYSMVTCLVAEHYQAKDIHGIKRISRRIENHLSDFSGVW